MPDIEKVLKNTVKKGTVNIGSKETSQKIKDKSAKLIILSKNCPYEKDIKKQAKKQKISVYTSDMNSIDLGYSCGKAFGVSSIAVIDDGGSNIAKIVKK